MPVKNEKDEYFFINLALFNLLMRCPLDCGSRRNCPLEEYRTTLNTREEKFDFITELHETSKLQILALHDRCLEMRLNNYLRCNPKYEAKIDGRANSLTARYHLVRTALDEPVERNKDKVFPEKVARSRVI